MNLLNIIEPDQIDENQDSSQEIAIGIDLGTTNSLVSFCTIKNKPEIIADEDGNLIQPSIVAIDDNQQILSGVEAKNCQNPLDKIYSVKRLIGKSVKEALEQSNLGFTAQEDEEQLKVKLGKKYFSPVEISAEILKTLKNIAQNNLSQPISKAVITVPAYFDEISRNETKNAALLAGIDVLRLVSEPTAAAIAYGLDKNIKGTFAVFDLGGGTFDISILKLQKGVFRVIGVGGDSNLGGDDFDYLIVKQIIKQNSLDGLSVIDLQNLKLAAKNIKEQLTNSQKASIDINLGQKAFNFELSNKDFTNLTQDLIQRTINITNNLIEELDLEIEDLGGVILVGGSTRMPIVKENLTKIFGKDKILDDIDPDQVVAMGAALQAYNLTHKDSSGLLLDVTPLSLGIEMMGGMVEKIILRNSSIPTSASKEFTTYKDGQTGMKFHILQGERELAQDCRSLANFEIKNIPPLKAGVARVKTTFTLDADGLLTIKAIEQITKQVQEIEIKPSFGLSDGEIKDMLIESMQSAKEDISKRLLVESKVESERNILAIKAALKEDGNLLTVDEANDISQQIINLEAVLQSVNREDIKKEAKKLEDLSKEFASRKMNRDIGKAIKNTKID